MAEVLEMPEYGFEVFLILDKYAKRRYVKRELENFFRSGAETYLFYFSGHGIASDLGVYLGTVDYEEEDEGIDLEFLKRLITNVAAPEADVVIILDCCHSGAATIEKPVRNEVVLHTYDINRIMPTLPRGRVILAACLGDQLAYEEYSLGHGIFTSHILDGLLGEAADKGGYVTVPSLYDYVARFVAASGLQTPAFSGDIRGRLILGQGLTPQWRPLLEEDTYIELEKDARQNWDRYRATIGNMHGEPERWKGEGYKMACQILEPFIVWTRHRISENPSLKSRPKFMEVTNAAMEELRHLSYPEVGTVTTKGMIVEKLGSGNFGSVWKINYGDVNKLAAYKIYHANELSFRKKVSRFRRGYDAMKQLDHPHIVKVYEYTECPLGFYMEYVNGPNFRDFIGTIEEPKELVGILYSVAETIKHAHRREVVHRDVKPENIILAYDENQNQWRPYLTDFDLAWFPTATAVTKETGLGTLLYAAPEQIKKPNSANAHAPTTDSYSFGQLCYFTVTGNDPIFFDNTSNSKTLEKRIRGGWSEESARIFLTLYEKCVREEPSQRPDFEEICLTLMRVITLHSATSDDAILPVGTFFKEIIFSLVGLSPENRLDENIFVSLSGRTRVMIREQHVYSETLDLIYDFYLLENAALHGGISHEQARTILVRRINNALNDFPNAEFRHGNVAPFQAFVYQNSVSRSMKGVAECTELIARIIDQLERTA